MMSMPRSFKTSGKLYGNPWTTLLFCPVEFRTAQQSLITIAIEAEL